MSERLLEDDRFDMLGYGWDEAGREKAHSALSLKAVTERKPLKSEKCLPQLKYKKVRDENARPCVGPCTVVCACACAGYLSEAMGA